MDTLTFVIGGARSGKSSFAEQFAKGHNGRVIYIATAEALDAEMAARIQRHREGRPGKWLTLEVPHGVGKAISAEGKRGDLVLIDCLTLLVSNVMLAASGNVDAPDEAAASRAVEAEVRALLEVVRDSPAKFLIVSNEVGMGLVPPYPAGRLYRDLLGWANREVAQTADQVYLLVAGMTLPLHKLGRHFQGES
jgi:adenosylcobinamide kinase/adenosylcobinamide-phosphate guanylyltransferase